MKKVLSIVLAVAVLATMAFSMMASTVSAEDKTYSLLPTSKDKFTLTEGGDPGAVGTVTVEALDNGGYKLKTDKGWPSAYYFEKNAKDGLKSSESWVMTKKGSGSTLNYNFEVVSGKGSIVVYFCGQNPEDQAQMGSFVSINGLIDKANVDSLTGETKVDLPVGKYSGSVDVDNLGYSATLLGDKGEMMIGGVKIYAVGGEVIVNDISVTEKSGYDNSHHKNVLANGPATAAPQNTTTVAKTTAQNSANNAQTGDTTNAIVFIAVAAVAAGAVVVTAKKQKAR